jgi:hypothetical protein
MAAAIGLWAVPAGGAEAFEVSAGFGWQNCYRPLEWTPIEVFIRHKKLKEPFGGTLILSVQQDGLNTMTLRRPFVLADKKQRLRLPLAARVSLHVSEVRLRIVNDRGRVVWSRQVDVYGYDSHHRLEEVGRDDLLVGVVGRVSSSLLRLDADAHAVRSGRPGKLWVKRKREEGLPFDWSGYASLDTLVLLDCKWSRISPHQSRAILDWVSKGGKVLLVLGGRPLPDDHPLADLLPFRPGQPRKVPAPTSLLGWWDQRAPRQVACWDLDVPMPPRWRKTTESGVTFCAVGDHGFGQVAVAGFNPAAAIRERGTELSGYWMNVLRLVLGPDRLAQGTYETEYVQMDYYQLGREGPATNRVIGNLYAPLKPLSIWWVIGVLGALAVLLGPVDYLVLRAAGRLPLTWITSTVVIVLFSVGAYYGVQAVRAGEMEIRVVSVVDGVKGGPTWSCRYSGIFSPAHRSYMVDGLERKEWWSGLAPTRGSYLLHEQEGFDSRPIPYHQEGGANLPIRLPISEWTMLCLLTERPGDEVPFEATVEDLGGGRLRVTLVNRSEHPIENACVRVAGDRQADLGPVPAGQTRVIERSFHPVSPWHVGLEDAPAGYYPYGPTEPNLSDPFTPGAAYYARGAIGRTRAILNLLDEGAAVVCAEYRPPEAGFRIEGKRCKYHHIRLARLVVFPRPAGGEAF